MRAGFLAETMNGKGNNGGKRDKRLILVDGAIDGYRDSAMPPHLASITWIDHEAQAAASAFSDLKVELKSLSKKVSANRVHKTRVVLRRWFSIWNVLRKDGWQSVRYERGPGRTLVKLQEMLGELRDLDVNLEQGDKLGCTKELLEMFVEKRQKKQERLEEYVARKDIDRVCQQVEKYLKKRAPKLKAKLPRAKAEQSAFTHIELYLLKQESITKEQAESAHTPEEFHELRLSIKRWRYVLTEFFGLTNLELVRAQQILGQMHDLDRLTPLLVHEEKQQKALEKLKVKRKELLQQIEGMRRRLPYGLRPEVTSLKAGTGTGSAR